VGSKKNVPQNGIVRVETYSNICIQKRSEIYVTYKSTILR